MSLWRERREMPGNTAATVEAYVVPASGVGWVDCTWNGKTVPAPRFKIKPEQRRLLADWTGLDHSSIVRQVVPVADEWFAHCTQLAERELAVVALAAAAEPVMDRGPIGMTGPGPGPPSGIARRQQLERLVEHLRKKMEELQRSTPGNGIGGIDWPSLFPEGYFGAKDGGYADLVHRPLPPQGEEQAPSQGLLSTPVGSAVLGATESTSDGPNQD